MVGMWRAMLKNTLALADIAKCIECARLPTRGIQGATD